MAHIIDSRVYGNGFGTPEMRAIFDEERRFGRWLEVEAALALTQAELGVIPHNAAEEIAVKANLGNVDVERVREGVRKANHSLVPLLKEVERACKDGLGNWIHYGVTTQDIQDTGLVLEMRDAFGLVFEDLKTVAAAMADMATQHRDTVMAGRTHGQHALPTTFGYKVSIWLTEIMRHLERMQQASERIFVASVFGGVGTMSALPHGIETLQGVATRLELGAAPVSWHTARDNIAEYTSTLALISGTLGKVSNEIYVLSRTECGELVEGHADGRIGSSTMPHKRNPEVSEGTTMLSRLTKYLVAVAMEAMNVEHDRDARAWRSDWVIIPEISCYTSAIVNNVKYMLEGLEVHTERMLENLKLQKDFLFSEALMFEAGKAFGKQTAHELVYEAAIAAREAGTSIVDQLMQNPEVAEKVTREQLDATVDPTRNLGAAPAMVDGAVRRARETLATL